MATMDGELVLLLTDLNQYERDAIDYVDGENPIRHLSRGNLLLISFSLLKFNRPFNR
jgi:hypothetical protein